ncbi:MAG: cation:proton antiporter, partial [Vulcanimicrobiaceae bacterium]
MGDLQFGVAAVVVSLGFALVVGVIAQRTRIPYSVALVVASLPLQAPRIQEQFTPALLLIFLPALIFEASWNIDTAALRRRWLLIAALAVPGVLLTAFFVAIGLTAAG